MVDATVSKSVDAKKGFENGRKFCNSSPVLNLIMDNLYMKKTILNMAWSKLCKMVSEFLFINK